MDVVVLKIENPSCFWLAVKDTLYETQYENLKTEMNQFYDSHKDADEVIPELADLGKVYVVFCKELKCWCRGVIESLQLRMDRFWAPCFLVDYAQHSYVPAEKTHTGAEMLHKALKSNLKASMKRHEESKCIAECVLQCWREMQISATPAVLDDAAEMKDTEDSTLHQRKHFHPEIKWFQDQETVAVKVKTVSATDTKCEFSREKVVFSAFSGGKLYLADLELHQPVLTEKSSCVIKDVEAVIVLVKEKQGAWCKLLKNKNIHVSLDFEHWEESEDEEPFPLGAAKLGLPPAETEEWVESLEDHKK